MSMAKFVADLGLRIRGYQAKGGEVTELWVSDAGEKVINAALMKEGPCTDVVLFPVLKIHGVPVAVHKRMPAGHVWYVIKGGKYGQRSDTSDALHQPPKRG
mgnify:CR=1 FL=1